ncbi:hypothetical protein F2Q68_00032030 [Brassica cretica]|uniref:Uncharacterized protein n=1 Tax=Brassica cretica TaxID=69181 RepID=A0A8S9G246_BRACR|nr:hypothetical protein F2Q68_00032025 [Brassica cretica]KAF2541853.1 hypothetical protein F2Q68_00032030 [Brassica cretica]
MVDSEQRYFTEKASSVPSMILYDCDAEALSTGLDKSKFCSILRGKPKNGPEAKEGSVRVQISLSRPVSVYMIKPWFCPRQDQSSPLQTFILGFG